MEAMVLSDLAHFDLIVPRKIIFGWGRRTALREELPRLGKRVLVISGSRTLEKAGLFDELQQLVMEGGLDWQIVARIHSEPTVTDVDEVSNAVRALGVRQGDIVLAVGGGSAIDLAKAVAAMVTQDPGASIRDYLENIGRNLKLIQPALPVVAVPTTAGTGAEATRNAVICSHDPPVKKSLRDDRIMPYLAVVDPELTVSNSRAITAAAGMDAITQLIESYVSVRRRPIPQILAPQALRIAFQCLPNAFTNPMDRTAREGMAFAALISGICLANSGLGMAHGVAAALGALGEVPHGIACAVMLPVALQVNRSVCPSELAYLARIAFDQKFANDEEAIDYLISEVRNLQAKLEIPDRLSKLGIHRELIPAIVNESRGSSMSGNPKQLKDDELMEVLEQIL
ncbi:MAG TPA: iron-containing alcohol dehydrogenase [Thermogutta sp.]|nr:iron-containing alcohol dehydrogenase [Thermogutta sp.]